MHGTDTFAVTLLGETVAGWLVDAESGGETPVEIRRATHPGSRPVRTVAEIPPHGTVGAVLSRLGPKAESFRTLRPTSAPTPSLRVIGLETGPQRDS